MHRTLDFGAGPIEVFETSFAALRWAKRHKNDCKVLARGRLYFQRKSGLEMTIKLNATMSEQNHHIVSAANTIADEIEKMIDRDPNG